MKIKFNSIVRIMLAIVVLLFMDFPNQALADNNIDIKRIDKYINEKFNTSNAPGLGVSIISKENILYMKSLGYSDVESKKILNNDTPLILGSTSKSFTALAIMQLVKEGKIDLNASVQRYLPWFKLRDAKVSSEIKVINLLDHTSGLKQFSAIKYISMKDLDDIKAYIENLENVIVEDPIGDKYNYSNENYQILGLIIEKVSGLSYEEYIKKYIFQPLDMENSFTSKTEAEKSNLASGYQFLWGIRVKRDLTYPKAYLPCGYIISSLEDMSKYMEMQINNGHFKERELIDPYNFNQMHSPQAVINESNCYAMGWIVGKTNGVDTISHDGAIENYRSNLIIIPNRNIGIVVMSNCNNMLLRSDIVSSVSNGIVSIINGDEVREVNKFPSSYLVINLALLLVILIFLSPLFLMKMGFRRNKVKFLNKYIVVIIINYFLPMLSFLYISRIIGTSWFFIFRYAPDVGITLITIYLILFIIGIIEMRIIVNGRKLLKSTEVN